VAFVVIYDASVLYPNTLRDLLIRIAQSGLAQAKWTDQIIDEMFAALKRSQAGPRSAQASPPGSPVRPR
jgi:hypothetical protein